MCPPWVPVMMAAEAWGIPPWQVDEGQAVWLVRFNELNRLQSQKQQRELKRLNSGKRS